jgi:enoyl-CoA hydratase
LWVTTRIIVILLDGHATVVLLPSDAGFLQLLRRPVREDPGVRAVVIKPEINIGIIPTFGGTQRLPRNVGRKAALELILSGRTFDAMEAARLGLVNRVLPAADLLSAALALARELASKPPLTIAAALAAIHRGMDASIDDGLAIEEAAFARIVPTHDAREGVVAFLEKRSARFLGR